jgi:hypothetical protein
MAMINIYNVDWIDRNWIRKSITYNLGGIILHGLYSDWLVGPLECDGQCITWSAKGAMVNVILTSSNVGHFWGEGKD